MQPVLFYGVPQGSSFGSIVALFQADMTVEQERSYLTEVIQTISDATGQSIKGWMGPALTETFETPKLLKELGLSYVLDWCADDQPFPLNIAGMISVPYSIELNDGMLFVGKSLSGRAVWQSDGTLFTPFHYQSAVSSQVP